MISNTIAVIGAGAAGLSAAIEAKRTAEKAGTEIDITVFEYLPKAGKKLLATGNGRCNFTNLNINPESFFGDSGFLPILSESTADASDFFNSLGVLTYTESGRVYPKSLQASSVVDALTSEAHTLGIKLVTDTPVVSIIKSDGGFIINKSRFGKVIAASGGKAGVKEDDGISGYSLLKKLGHSVILPLPALVYIKSPDKALKMLNGVRAKGKITLYKNKAVLGSDTGEIQFTQRGISGIPAMNLSHLVADGATDIKIDLCPDNTTDFLSDFISERISSAPGKETETLLSGLVNKKIGYLIMERAKIPQNAPVGTLGKNTLCEVTEKLKGLEFKVSGTGDFSEAQVTAGGLPASEFDIKTLESKLLPGLYAAGELLNIHGKCGGFNLHLAWASGRLAGKNAALSYAALSNKDMKK